MQSFDIRHPELLHIRNTEDSADGGFGDLRIQLDEKLLVAMEPLGDSLPERGVFEGLEFGLLGRLGGEWTDPLGILL